MNDLLLLPSIATLGLTIAASLVWVARDAEKRERSSVWIAFLCLVT
jgi:hypothetical protein